MTTTTERINALLAAADRAGRTPDAYEIAMTLVDEDVAAGDYEGCSADLDMAASEYVAAAERMIDGGW